MSLVRRGIDHRKGELTERSHLATSLSLTQLLVANFSRGELPAQNPQDWNSLFLNLQVSEQADREHPAACLVERFVKTIFATFLKQVFRTRNCARQRAAEGRGQGLDLAAVLTDLLFSFPAKLVGF